jgi:hypothetical protein
MKQRKTSYTTLVKAKAKEKLMERLKIDNILNSHVFLCDQIILEGEEPEIYKLDPVTTGVIQQRLKRYFKDWINPNIETLFR